MTELRQVVGVGAEENIGFDIGLGDGNATKKAATKLDG